MGCKSATLAAFCVTGVPDRERADTLPDRLVGLGDAVERHEAADVGDWRDARARRRRHAPAHHGVADHGRRIILKNARHRRQVAGIAHGAGPVNRRSISAVGTQAAEQVSNLHHASRHEAADRDAIAENPERLDVRSPRPAQLGDDCLVGHIDPHQLAVIGIAAGTRTR